MSDPSLALSDAVIAKLKASPALPHSAAVYDDIPTSAAFPYVSLGQCQVLPDKAECIDGSEVFFSLDVWTRTVGYVATKQIAKAIIDKLDDQPLVVAGFDVIVFELSSVEYLRDPDGKTRHASVLFRSLIQVAS